MPIKFIDDKLDLLLSKMASVLPRSPLLAEFKDGSKSASKSDECYDGIWSWIRSMDIFPKFDTAYLRQTSTGGLGSIICFSLMALLMAFETIRYFAPNTVQEFTVDRTVSEKLPLEFSISVGSPCAMLMVAMMDETGQTKAFNSHMNEIKMEEILLPKDLKKGHIRVLRKEEADEMEEAPHGYNMGCRISTPKPIMLDRIDGKLAVLPITEAMGILGAMIMAQDQIINFSHIIHRMSFGRDYPGQKNPLNGQSQPAMEYHEDFIYFLSVLPTKYKGMWRRGWINSNQYSLIGYLGQKNQSKVEKPGLYFAYKIEPLSLQIRQERTAFRTFLISLVGILGGIYTVFGIVNSVVVSVWDFCVGKGAARRRNSSVRSCTSTSTTRSSISMQSIEDSSSDPFLAKNPDAAV